MDERFPKYVYFLCRKLKFLNIPNLGMLLVGLGILGFIGIHSGMPMEEFTLNPHRILDGEFWRLITFPVTEAPDGPIWLLFYCLYVYFVMSTLELHWGTSSLTIFVFLCYLFGILGSFIVAFFVPEYLWRSLPLWHFLLENITLAFGTLFPDVELSFFGVIPIKAKYFAYLGAIIIFLKLITGGTLNAIFIILAMAPYLLFFGPMLFKAIHRKIKNIIRKKKFDSDMWK